MSNNENMGLLYSIMSKPANRSPTIGSQLENPTLSIGDDIIINRQGKQNYARVIGFNQAMIDIQLYYNQADILSLLTGVKKWEQSQAIEILQFSNIMSDTYLLSNCRQLIHPIDIVQKTIVDTPYCYDRDRNVVTYHENSRGQCNFAKMNQCNQILSEIKRQSIIPNDEGVQIWKYRQCLPEGSKDVQFLENDFDLIHQINDDHKDYLSSITDKQMTALKFYSEQGSEGINSYLATPTLQRRTSEDMNETIKDLRTVIANAPLLPQPLIVYRGIRSKSYNDSFIKALQTAQIGDELQLPDGGFISTSLSSKVALQFAKSPCCFIVIYLPKGTHGLFLGDNSAYADEWEYLLSDQQRFRYFMCGQSLPEITSSFGRSQEMSVYHVVAI
jgi:hypothetical protein